MNTNWSDHIQGINTLFLSRQLRFDDHFKDQYLPFFSLDSEKKLRILEIGCGPGALATALHRWYHNAEIVAIDRDSAFIAYARERVPGVTFLEGDATSLPFDDASFDVTISNTVSEHIEPNAFYGEQMRVLKKGGVCLVLSGRKGIHHRAACLEESEYEKAFWSKIRDKDHSMETYQVCKYPQNEQQHPALLSSMGFSNVSTGYAILDLTPDDPKYPDEMSLGMIEAERANDIDAILTVRRSLSEYVSKAEEVEMLRITQEKFDRRIRQYFTGEKQWDTTVSVTMLLRGEKL